jgi:hypothetical protein
LFVAAELLKRGIQISITFGNAKAIDLRKKQICFMSQQPGQSNSSILTIVKRLKSH